MSAPWIDIAGHSLGTPHEVIAVRERADVVRALRSASALGKPFAAVGLRASYWHNLSLEGAIVADLRGFDRVLGLHEDDGVMTVQSGVTIRELDRALRQRGYQLAMHPDSFGDTLIGSAIANGVTAGMGMMRRSFLDQIVGMEVVLPDGRPIQLGASRVTGHPEHGISRGLPDLRSLWFGAEGALGVITEIDLALVPVAWEAHLEYRVTEDRGAEALALAKRWRRRDLFDTIRWEWDGAGTLGLFLSTRVDPAELETRIGRARRELRDWPEPRVVRFDKEYRQGRGDAYEAKWRGPPGETWRRAEKAPFFGIDGILPWTKANEGYDWARALDVPGADGLRVALYFGADGVNLGIHGVSVAQREAARGALEDLIPELHALGAIPYRPGLVWIRSFRERLDEASLNLLGAVSDVLDPDRRLNPGVGMLGGAKRGS